MKKVLFVTYNNPEKIDNGDKRYTWDILNSLKKDNEVFLHVVAYFEEKKESLNDYVELEKLCDKVTYVPFKYKSYLSIGFSKYPAMIANRKTKEMIVTVQNILSEDYYDSVMINMFRLAYMIEYLKEFSVKKIFISHNVEYLISKSVFLYSNRLTTKTLYYFDYIKAKYWEKRFLSQYDCVSAICDVDIDIFQKVLDLKNLFLLTPLVDMNTSVEINKEDNKTLIVCGAFTWAPKTINLQRLLNAANIQDINSLGCKLNIIGRANKSEIDKGNKIPGVFVSGEVASVDPYYSTATVALVPELAGGGFKLKIAEAVQNKLPIVAIKGSVTDKKMIPGYHYIEVETFEELISKGLDLLNDKKIRDLLVTNATSLFEKRYNIDTVHTQLMKEIFY